MSTPVAKMCLACCLEVIMTCRIHLLGQGAVSVSWRWVGAGSSDIMTVTQERVALKQEGSKVKQERLTVKLEICKVKIEEVKVFRETAGLERTPDNAKRSLKSGKSGAHKRGSRAGRNEWSKRKDAMRKSFMELLHSSPTISQEQVPAAVSDMCCLLCCFHNLLICANDDSCFVQGVTCSVDRYVYGSLSISFGGKSRGRLGCCFIQAL